MKARKQFKQSLKTSVIKSALIHVCVILLFAISPGFNITIKEKPIDVVWVELPKGTGDDFSLGIGPPDEHGYPAAPAGEAVAGQPGGELAPTEPPPMELEPTEPPPMEQEPLEVQAKVTAEPTAKPMKAPTIEKSVTTTTRMTYQKKGAPRRRQIRRMRKTDRTIAGALASIDKSLADRSTGTGSGSGTGTGYRYGTGARAIRVAPTDPEYIKYQARVRSRIMSNWVVPERFASAGTRATARLIVMINMNGAVISTRWSKPSGNPTFDEAAKRAVAKASPLPKPPERMAWETYNEGFLIEFDARVR